MASVVTSVPVIDTIMQRNVDVSVVPYMRYVPIVIQARNLMPFANANVWMDDVNVNQFTQPSSYLQANSGFTFKEMLRGEGLYCNTTHAYAQVMEYSVGGQVCYLDANYTTLNLTPYGPLNSNSFNKTTYNVGDLVYQTSNNNGNVHNATMVGQVIYWANQDGALVVTMNTGSMSNSAGNLVLFKSGSTFLSNVGNVVYGNKFPTNASVISTLNVHAIFTVNAWNSYHGVVPFPVTNTHTIQLSSNINSNVVNSKIYITAGGGVGQNAKIISITSNNLITLNTTLTGIIGNSYYGIGNVVVDEIGVVAAICRVPEDASLKFPTGSRLITLNNGKSSTDNSATMLATATFQAAGQISTSASVPTTPGIPPNPLVTAAANTVVAPSTPTSTGINNNSQSNNPTSLSTPLVQTFFTPKPTINETDNGIFCTSIQLYFAGKPSGSDIQFPVDVYICETVSGYPTNTLLAASSVRSEDVITTDGIATFPNTQNNLTSTKFVFADPVYLAPGTEYGIVVYSESPAYDVWVGQLGEPIVNSTRLASAPPYVSSFYVAQNASKWNPINGEFLMFVLNKAQFNTANVANVNFQVQPYAQNTYIDQLILHSTDMQLPPCNLTYGFQSLTANSLVQDSGFTIIQTDTPFSFGSDLNNSSSADNRRRVIDSGNNQALLLKVNLLTTDPDTTPAFHTERLTMVGLTNIINAGEIAPDCIAITNPGNHINAANIVVTIDTPTGLAALQTRATANVVSLNGNSVIAINIINPGGGYVVTPNITLSEPGAPVNATAQIAGETSQHGGNGLMRYITRPLTLANGFDAGDLVVYMDAIRPQGTDIQVYYKVLSSQDTQTLANCTWQQMSIQSEIFSPDQKTSVSLVFNTGTNSYGIPKGSVSYTQGGISYPIGGSYSSYQIKIVGFTEDPTVPPILLDFRATSVPAG